MKIAHYINNLGSGGAEKQLVDYLPLLKEKNNEIKLIVSNNNVSIPDYLTELSQKGIEVIDLKSSFYSPMQIFKLIRVIRKEKFDIVHSHLFPSQYWLAFASFFFSKRVKLIKTEHAANNERRNFKLFKIIEKLIYSRYLKVIGITDDVTRNLSNWIGDKSEKIITIPNGVILQNPVLGLPTDLEIFEKNNFNILMVARLSQENKNHKDLILSLKYLPKHVHLFFAGEGPDENSIKKIAIDNNLENQVHFLGMRTDARKLMDNANLNALISHVEGLSGVALESMASRRPFIGSNISGINNIVPNRSFLYENGNPSQLAAIIKKIMESSQSDIDQLVLLGNEKAKNFDLNNIVKLYNNMYKNLLNNHN